MDFGKKMDRENSTFGVFHNVPERMAQLPDDLECMLLFHREACELLESKSNSRPVPEFP